jgi:hypothetical protein
LITKGLGSTTDDLIKMQFKPSLAYFEVFNRWQLHFPKKRNIFSEVVCFEYVNYTMAYIVEKQLMALPESSRVPRVKLFVECCF